MSKSKRIYFPGIDTLRAIGAISVLLGHIELSKKTFDLPNLTEVPFYKFTSGHIGVILFYTLSGFLITYLLLKEKSEYNNIDVKSFYIRRVLRIWPIYYLFLFFIMFAFPQLIDLPYFGRIEANDWGNHVPTMLIYIFFIPNIMVFGIPGIGGAFHLGTIGVEEQFYLFWPWLIKIFKKAIFPLIVIFLGISLAPHFNDYFRAHYLTNGSYSSEVSTLFTEFFAHFKINAMAMGGIAAWVYFEKRQIILNIIYHKWVSFFVFLLGFGGWILGMHFPFFTDEIYSVLFGIIILNVATNENSLLKLNATWSNFVGKISYGIYVYHWIFIYIGIFLLEPFEEQLVVYNVLLYLFSFSTTILISYISFHFFERRILLFKERFARIKSNRVIED